MNKSNWENTFSGNDYSYANAQRTIRDERKRLLKKFGVRKTGTIVEDGDDVFMFDGVGYVKPMCRLCHRRIKDKTELRRKLCFDCMGRKSRFSESR